MRSSNWRSIFVGLASVCAACSTVSPERPERPDAAPEAPAVQPANPEPATTDRTPFLLWNFDEGYVPDQSPQYTICRARSVSWVNDADQVVWTRPLPTRMAESDTELCECRRADGSGACAAELEFYLRNPRALSPTFVLGTQDLGERIITADRVGVLALAKSDGAVALDRALPLDPEKTFFVDDGTYEVEGDASCRGDLRHGRLFVRCGDRLVYFNGTTAAVIRTSDLVVLAIGTFDGVTTPGRQGAPYATRIQLGAEWLYLEGIIYL